MTDHITEETLAAIADSMHKLYTIEELSEILEMPIDEVQKLADKKEMNYRMVSIEPVRGAYVDEYTYAKEDYSFGLVETSSNIRFTYADIESYVLTKLGKQFIGNNGLDKLFKSMSQAAIERLALREKLVDYNLKRNIEITEKYGKKPAA